VDDIEAVLRKNTDVCLKRKVGTQLRKIMYWDGEWIIISQWRLAASQRRAFGGDLGRALKKFLE
jgi:hypothetical protein